MPALMQRKYSFSIDISPFRIFRALAGPHMAQLTTVSVSTLHAGVNDRMCDFLGIPVNGVSVFRYYGIMAVESACSPVTASTAHAGWRPGTRFLAGWRGRLRVAPIRPLCRNGRLRRRPRQGWRAAPDSVRR